MEQKIWTVERKCRLDEFLRRELPLLFPGKDVSNSKIRRLIVAGSIFVNGKQCRIPAYDLFPKSKVCAEIEEDKFFFEKQPEDIDYVLTEQNVLFEDESIIIVNKPAFLPTEGTIVESRKSMHSCVIDYLWKKNPSLRNPPYVGIMHRLDRETSGVLLFTKTRQVNKAVSDMFQNHAAVKTYRAVACPQLKQRGQTPWRKPCILKTDLSSNFRHKNCEAILEQRGQTPEEKGNGNISLQKHFVIENYIGRIAAKSAQCRVGPLPESKGGQYAKTDFTVVAVDNEMLYVDCRLYTGRTHQIRVHLSGCGLPLLGDTLYGGKTNKRIMLHAMSLEFPHPVTGQIMKVEAPLPEGFDF
ncbi:pseudouridine synthase [Treponema sp.]|uniref:RluA family pseudouridine synthase n=1 Tax=Treponema sp. TaxID=166 RepID=UPI00388DD217